MFTTTQKSLFCLAAVLAVAAAGCSEEQDQPPIACQPDLTSDVKIQVDEKSNSFAIDKARVAGGNARITVTVPTSAKNSHGVAIDGGIYKNVAGAGVKPGRASSLTIELKPGRYTVYDPVAHNRDKGFTSKLVVGKMAPTEKTSKPCLPPAHLPR